MVDKNGTRIFASLNEDGKGGDIPQIPFNFNEQITFSCDGVKIGKEQFSKEDLKFYIEVIGIKQ